MAAEAESSVTRNARHNAAIAWIRLPISIVVSGFLFVFVDSRVGWVWLAVVLMLELIAWLVRARLVAGDTRFRIPHLFAISSVTIAWITLALVLWNRGGEVPRLATLVTLFSVAIYGVAGGYKSVPVLLALGVPPVLALFAILTNLAWASLEFGPALLTTFATLSACATIGFTGWALHKSDRGLETANADLRSLTHQLTILAERERVASAAKDKFLANVSHEIRTPLNGIIGLASTLERGKLSVRDQVSVDVIRESGEMLERLISDVLDAAAIDAGRLQLKINEFNPLVLARSAVLLMEAEARKKALLLSMTGSLEAPRILMGDDVRIRQVILNLLSNAIKYTEVGSVTLDVGIEKHEAERDAYHLRLRVSDTGVGFDQASHEKLFERFERGDHPVRDTHAGLGLGLTITRALVDAMGGEIRVSSKVGAGSIFEVSLPLLGAPASPEGESSDKRSAAAQSLLARRERPLRILLAEDHPINRLVVTTILAAVGAEIETAIDGREAVAAAARTRFDAILMDHLMPVLDGLEATLAIRRHEAENHLTPTAIIMLTASALPSQVETAEIAGCDAHLTKPVTPARLFEALAEVLKRAGKGKS
jgi:signal transduction histidine kinase/ActR/RegA family two-component response regulator